MIRLIPGKAWLIAGGLVAIIAAVGFIRWDAARDAKKAAELKQAKDRVKVLIDTRRRQNEVQDLSDDALRDALLGRVNVHGPQ